MFSTQPEILEQIRENVTDFSKCTVIYPSQKYLDTLEKEDDGTVTLPLLDFTNKNQYKQRVSLVYDEDRDLHFFAERTESVKISIAKELILSHMEFQVIELTTDEYNKLVNTHARKFKNLHRKRRVEVLSKES